METQIRDPTIRELDAICRIMNKVLKIHWFHKVNELIEENSINSLNSLNSLNSKVVGISLSNHFYGEKDDYLVERIPTKSRKIAEMLPKTTVLMS